MKLKYHQISFRAFNHKRARFGIHLIFANEKRLEVKEVRNEDSDCM